MPNYEKYKCPVCNQQFSRDDDIVTCPECGTPHHRECYGLTGHCVNRGLHSTGYSFLEEHKPLCPMQVLFSVLITGAMAASVALTAV